MEKLRFGIVGCGVIGPTHAEALQSLPQAELVAVADVIPEKAQKLADKFHATAYTDLQEMLDREQLDVVDVCTPSGMHGEHACQIMRSGRHVIIEKPMEIRKDRIEEILQVQRETGKKVAVISQHRFDEASQQVHQLIQEQALGRMVLGNAAIPWWRSQKYYDSGAWRGTWALDGGGILMNQSIHSIDILQWLMGRVKTIRAYTDTLVHKMETEDVAVAVLRFESGALGTISATTGAYPGATTRIEVFGDKGSAIIEDDRLGYLHLASQDSEEVGPYGGGRKKSDAAAAAAKSTASDPAALQASTHAQQIADMIRAIQEDGTPLVDGHSGRHPVEIILGIYEAASTGKEVTLS
ncbi:Gfo/Idh/MocA family protein [Dictyobacter aurantiacus]|uniref:Oxidoreductase n=1 Tax=Dictyobacter aurantiacus TaxID=1936993 RepID=A0A401ZL70_9CHLR|nr:Gfo/Idh/MocA family oxidoreductase [Dictyobacter aurantiacus]GCE07593.1 oxidoreductase [Dictyobacter aurantiacus]